MSTLRAALEGCLASLPVMRHENGYSVEALPKADLLALLALHTTVVHLIADGEAVTSCCGKTAFELPMSERITVDPSAKNCGPGLGAGPQQSPSAEEIGTEGHDLVVSYGDCEFYGVCSCGQPLGSIKPDKSLDELGLTWERHVMTEVPR